MTRQITVKRSPDTGLKLRMTPVTVTPDCDPAITDLLWFSDDTGDYTETLETALLLTDGAANPVLAVAQLLGETCDQELVWSAVWENSEGGDTGEPGAYIDGQHLIIYQLPDTVPGMLAVSVIAGSQRYGPIDLITSEAICGSGSGGGQCGEFRPWYDGFTIQLEPGQSVDPCPSGSNPFELTFPGNQNNWVQCNGGVKPCESPCLIKFRQANVVIVTGETIFTFNYAGGSVVYTIPADDTQFHIAELPGLITSMQINNQGFDYQDFEFYFYSIGEAW